MKPVTHLVTCLGFGGTERQLVTLLGGLDRERWGARVICFHKKGEYVEVLRKMGIEPQELTLGASLARPATAWAIARLARELVATGAALVHCHDIYSVVIGVPAAILAGVPVIAARRDLGHHVSRVMRPALRLALRNATRVLVNAQTIGAQVEHEDGVPASRLAVIPNGIDVTKFTTDAPPRHAKPTVIMVGRMAHAIKGHDDLLEAAAIVRKTVDARFVFVGDGPREGVLRAQAEALGLTDHVEFLGARADVPALLAAADVVCHPARAEGLPNAVIEAMAAGRPIVASAAGGVPELIHDGVHGLLVPIAQPARLAEALRELLSDRPRGEALGRAARVRASTHFTTDRLIERTDRLYQDVLHSSPAERMMEPCTRRSSLPAI